VTKTKQKEKQLTVDLDEKIKFKINLLTRQPAGKAANGLTLTKKLFKNRFFNKTFLTEKIRIFKKFSLEKNIDRQPETTVKPDKQTEAKVKCQPPTLHRQKCGAWCVWKLRCFLLHLLHPDRKVLISRTFAYAGNVTCKHNRPHINRQTDEKYYFTAFNADTNFL
jgi:hypothetical protein